MADPVPSDLVFPPHSFHIIAGPARAGADTLLFQLAGLYVNGGEMLGCTFEPSKVCIVSAVDVPKALRRKLMLLGLEDIPHVSLIRAHRDEMSLTMDNAIALARKALKVEDDGEEFFVFLDGLSILAPKINDDSAVSDFTSRTKSLCDRERVTVFSSMRANKSGVDSLHQSPGERVCGSGNWGIMVATLVFLDYHKAREPMNPARAVYLLPENKTFARTYWLKLNGEGLFDETVAVAEVKTVDLVLNAWWDSVEAGRRVELSAIKEAGEVGGVSERSVYYWIKERVELGDMVKVEDGVYQKRAAS